MAYSIHPATVEDAPGLAQVFHKAFEDNPVMALCHPRTPKDILLERDMKSFTRAIEHGALYGEHFTKVVVVDDDDNDDDAAGAKTVGFAAWQYPHFLTPQQQVEKERVEEEAQKERYPPGSQVGLIDDFFGQLFAGRKKWIDKEKMFFMHILVVHPDHQGKGLGSRLLKIGLREADKAGARTYIEASPAGLPLYEKYGWKAIDETVIDLRPYGGDGVERGPMMMREPGATKIGD